MLLTYGPAARRATVGGPDLAGQVHRRVRLGARPARGQRVRHAELAQGGEGGGRRGRGDRAVELPLRGDHQQDRPGAGHRQHGHPEARARHAVERHPHRPSGGRADRLPRRCIPGGDDHRQRRRRGPGHRSAGRPDLLHRFDRGRATDHGEGRPDPQAALPRAGWQVGRHRARGRRLRGQALHRLDRLHPRRAGLRDADPAPPAALALRRGDRADGGGVPHRALRRPDRSLQLPGPPDQRRPSGTRSSATSSRAPRTRVRGSSSGGRKPAHLRQGLLRRADPHRRRRQLDDHRPRGDLRSGPRGDPLRGRRRRGAHRQRQSTTASAAA